MDEYISREAVNDLIEDIRNNHFILMSDRVTLVLLKSKVAEIPATDVQPVKRGCWEEVTDYGGWGDTHYRCSVCGEEWYLEDGKPKDNDMNFCPRCGARMIKDGETE